MADATRAVDIIFRGTDQVSPAIKSIDQSLLGISGGADDAAKSVDQVGGKMEELGGKPRASVEAAATALKALAASLIVKDFIQANVAFETFERTMTLVKGSSEAAAKEFDYLQQLTNTLGLEVLSTAKNYADLSAATRGTNLEGQGTREIFEAVSIAMAALGKSSADTQGALNAVTQIVSKGTVSMEELRQQLGERVPGAFQIAAESMGLTTQELDKLVSSGKLAAEDFLPKFAAGLKEAFGDVSYVDTYTASLNRLKNSVTDAELIIGRGGGFDVLTKLVETGTLAVVGAISAFEVYGSAIGITLAAIATLDFTNFGDAMAEALAKGATNTREARDAFLGLNDAAENVVVSVEKIADRDNGDLWKLEPIQAYTQEMEKVAEQSQKTLVELEKIASNERIKNLEFKVELDVANIEAGAKKTVAAFESISASITSTSDLLGSLFGDLNEADNFRDRFQIEDQIKLENERRQEQLDLQKKLTETQIRAENARIERMASGDAIININGDGLQPHLEAFMWEILEVIQVRVNADGLDMLLGAP